MDGKMRTHHDLRCTQSLIRLSGITLAILSAILGLQNQGVRAAQRIGRADDHIERYVRRSERFAMDPADIEKRVQAGGHFAVATGDGSFDLVVVPHDIRAPWYRAEEETEEGIARPIPRSRIYTYRGFVVGLADSEVRLSIRPDAVEGIILTPREWYFVEPMRNYSSSAALSDMVSYRASDIREGAIGSCGVSLAERIFRAKDYYEPRVAAGTGISTADVATEADYEYVTALGGSTEANTSIMDVMNQVDGIYRSQLSLSLRVVYQHTWATASDPYSSTAPSTMLSEFRTYWGANFGSITYDLAHMWTGKDMDGATVGIAYLGVVCNARSAAYGVSQRLTVAPAKYIVTAHEIGHNFDASHPDQATSPPPDCTNTVMNSSIGTGTNFCQFSKDEISTHVTQFPTCLTAGTSGNCDITNDGTVNVLDIQALVNAILGASACPGNCDINKDGKINVQDLQLLANIVLGVAFCP
ncbi:MAG TPA: M12 family metallo-peptidase [Acidobacteriota bacterium]|nr:M12 family metallo-peptidase [Acidobacteriota bacterium]